MYPFSKNTPSIDKLPPSLIPPPSKVRYNKSEGEKCSWAKMPRMFYKQAQYSHPDTMELGRTGDESVHVFKDAWYVSIHSMSTPVVHLYYSACT